MCFDQIQPYSLPSLSSHASNPSATTWSFFLNQLNDFMFLLQLTKSTQGCQYVHRTIRWSTAEVSALKQAENSSSESMHKTCRSQKLSLRCGRASWKENIFCFEEWGYRISAGLFLRLKNKEQTPWKQWRTLEVREKSWSRIQVVLHSDAFSAATRDLFD